MILEPKYLAKITFLPADQGGMKNLPEDNFAVPIRIRGDERWTLVMDFLWRPSHGKPVTAFVDFLADDAPREYLVEKTPFEVLQGATVIADGQITIAQASSAQA
jgi:hypothetical protein